LVPESKIKETLPGKEENSSKQMKKLPPIFKEDNFIPDLDDFIITKQLDQNKLTQTKQETLAKITK